MIYYLFPLLLPFYLFAATVRRQPQALYPAALIFLFMIWQGISVAYLETGKYSFELLTTTGSTGATFRLSLALAALFGTYWAGFAAAAGASRGMPALADSTVNEKILTSFIAALMLSSALLLIKAPGPEDLAYRNLYIATNPSPLRDNLLKYLPVMTFAVGLAASLSSGGRIINAAYLSVLCGVLALIRFGHKFGALIDILFPFYLPIVAVLIADRLNTISLKRHLPRTAILLLVTALLSATAFSKYITARTEGMGPEHMSAPGSYYLKERLLVLQGGLWWITDLNAVHKGQKYTFAELRDFAAQKSFWTLSPSNAYITEKALGKEKAEYLLELCIQYTSSAPAVFYSFAGIYGPATLYAISGLLLGFVSWYLVRKILFNQPLRAVVAFTLYAPIYNFILGGEIMAVSPLNLTVKVAVLLALENAGPAERLLKRIAI